MNKIYTTSVIIVVEVIGENTSMKKIVLFVVLAMFCCPIARAANSSQCVNHSHGHSYNHTHHSGSSSSSTPVYLINKDSRTDEVKFPNCNKHYAITETTTNYYSDGTRRIFSNSTIYNSDGTVLISGCNSVKHIISDTKHYFIINKNKSYKIIDENAKILTTRKYTRMEEIEPNRILVKFDKKYGIIDLEENTIVPIKYKSFESKGHGIFLTKLNGYYGITDINNNTLVKNDCEKIKQVSDLFILKRYHKYGLADKTGKIILNPDYDKIKELGEYILVKKNGQYGIWNSDGENIAEIQYKSIKLHRNTLKGLTNRNVWIEINQN